MTRTLISLTARQLLGRRRTLVMLAALAIPVLIAVLASRSDSDEPPVELALGLVGALILTLLLPIVTLVLGTASLGAEIEDGTAIFLLSKPIDRWRIIAVKAAVAAAIGMAVVVPSVVATTWITQGDLGDNGLVAGLSLGAIVATALYSLVFVALSALTSRALIIGLVYVFVWEGLLTNLFNGLRWFSIREYAFGWSDAFIAITDPEVYDPRLSVTGAVIASIVLGLASFAIGTYALSRFEIGERA